MTSLTLIIYYSSDRFQNFGVMFCFILQPVLPKLQENPLHPWWNPVNPTRWNRYPGRLRDRSVQLTLAPNPSHLEAVDPVVLGMTRAKQARQPTTVQRWCQVMDLRWYDGFYSPETSYGLWYIYLHENHNNHLNVGKYIPEMDPMGIDLSSWPCANLTSEIELIIDLHSIFETTEPPSVIQDFKKNMEKTPPDTPWKINMEPTNHPFRKENDLPNLHDYVAC